MTDSAQSAWFYIAVIGFAAGIWSRSFLEFGLPEISLIALVAFAVALVGHKNGLAIFAPYFLFSLALFLFALGALRLEWATWYDKNPTLEKAVGERVMLEGMIKREPEDRPTSVHLYVETKSGLILVTTERGPDWRYGDIVMVEGKLSKPEPFETELGRSFDYTNYLRARGVPYTVSYAEVEKVAGDGGIFLIRRLLSFKQSFMDQLEQVLPEPAAGLSEGLLLGVKRALGEELEQTFRRAGIIHIVVLSGYNVMIVVYFMLFILRRFFGRRVSTVSGILAIAAFALLVGLSATVVRASIMAALLLLMNLTGRIYLALRGLLVAGVLMLIWNPYLLAFDVGFQLSFLATLGLILAAPLIEERITGVPTIFNAREFLVATLATQLFVLPLLLYQIGEFSLVAVVVNLLVLPMVPLAMLLSFLSGTLALASVTLALPFSYLTYLSLAYIIVVAKWFADLPFAAITVPPFPFWLVPLSYLGIGLLLWYLNRPPDLLKGWVIREI